MLQNPGRVIRLAFVSNAMLREQPATLFAFGDNMVRDGLGGQAGAMRYEPNAVGVPTLWMPKPFNDADMLNPVVMGAINAAFWQMRQHIAAGYDVVIPAAGLGTGIAQLPRWAPNLAAYIETQIGIIEASASAVVDSLA